MRRFACLSLIVTLSAFGVALPRAEAQVAELKAGSFIIPNTISGKIFSDFVAKVNKEGKGLVEIKLLAGPDAVPPFELANALRTGVLDLINLPPGYYAGILPEADATKLANVDPVEQRKNGAWVYLNRLHNERMNAQLLAQYLYGTSFHIYLRKKIDKPDLTGLRIRGVPTYRAFLERLGAAVVTIPHGEVYTALERGVIEGYAFPLWELKEIGFLPVTKYRVDPGFYQNMLNILVNLDTWKKLNPAQQALLDRQGRELETEIMRRAKEIDEEEYRKQKEGKVEVIEFKGPAAQSYLTTATSAGWDDIVKRSPEHGKKLRELLTKP